MDNDFEIFGTKEEAEAFVKGMEIARDAIDDDHLWIGEPTPRVTMQSLPNGEWVVEYGMTC
jgi:hypothetical protein